MVNKLILQILNSILQRLVQIAITIPTVRCAVCRREFGGSARGAALPQRLPGGRELPASRARAEGPENRHAAVVQAGHVLPDALGPAAGAQARRGVQGPPGE